MAAYILFGIEAQHLLTAVIMTAPGTLMMAKMFVPETGVPETMGTVQARGRARPTSTSSTPPAAAPARGCTLALNVGAMLISFLALIALVNALLGLVGPEPAADLRLGLRADRLEPWACRGGRADDRQPARHAHGAQRVRRLRAARAAQGRRSIRGRSRSRRSRCAASPTSARSASRSAASARWCRRGATTWRGSASARCWPARWPTSSPRRSRGSCCELGQADRSRRLHDFDAGRSDAADCAASSARIGDGPGRRHRARLRPRRVRRARSTDAVVDAVRRHSRTGRRRRSSATPAGWWSARSARPARRGAVGPRALLRGPRPAHGDVRRRACSARLGVQTLILTNAAGGINTGVHARAR